MRPPSFAVQLLALFTAAFVATFWFVALPEIQQAGQARQRFNQVSANQPKGTSTDSGDSASALADLTEETRALLPLSDDQYDLSVQVEALAKKYQVTLSSLSVSLPAKLARPATTGSDGAATPTPSASAKSSAAASTAVEKVTVAVGITASYEEIQRFVYGLTSLSRYMQVDQITITGSATAESNPQLAAQIVAVAYYLPASSSSSAK